MIFRVGSERSGNRASMLVSGRRQIWVLLIAACSLSPVMQSQEGGKSVTFQYQRTSATIQNGTAISMDPNGATTTIYVLPSHFSCSDKVSGNIAVSFTDPGKGQGSFYSAPFSFTGPRPGSLDLNDGGNAVLTYSINGGPTNTITFKILGSNMDPVTVDSWAHGTYAPWFFTQLLQQESGYVQFLQTGYPKIGRPDGIGISQIDATANPVGDYDYWQEGSNIIDGYSHSNDQQSTAYTFFQNQLNQAGPANPPPSPIPEGNCTFASTPNNSSTHPLKDADWIHIYNGTGEVDMPCSNGVSNVLYTAGYYLSWQIPSGAAPYWYIRKTVGGCFAGRSYVGDVCSKQPR